MSEHPFFPVDKLSSQALPCKAEPGFLSVRATVSGPAIKISNKYCFNIVKILFIHFINIIL